MTTKQGTIEEAVGAGGAAETKATNSGNGGAEGTEPKATEGQASLPATSQVPAVRTGSPMNIGDRGIALVDLNSLWRFSGMVLDSAMAPPSFKSQAAVAVAIQMGMELGMSPVMALQNIAVINGKPAPYGAIVKGMIEKSGLLDEYEEHFEGAFPSDTFKAVVTSRRKGRSTPLQSEFSIDDAKRAGLWEKAGPWKQYPKRMLMWRARQFNYNDNFADVTKGFRTAEEVADDVIDTEVVGSGPISMPARASETAPASATEEAPAS